MPNELVHVSPPTRSTRQPGPVHRHRPRPQQPAGPTAEQDSLPWRLVERLDLWPVVEAVDSAEGAVERSGVELPAIGGAGLALGLYHLPLLGGGWPALGAAGALAFHRSTWAPLAGGATALVGSGLLGPWGGVALPLMYAARNVDVGRAAGLAGGLPGVGAVTGAVRGGLERAGVDPAGFGELLRLLGQGAGAAAAQAGEHVATAGLAAADCLGTWARGLFSAAANGDRLAWQLIDHWNLWPLAEAVGWAEGAVERSGVELPAVGGAGVAWGLYHLPVLGGGWPALGAAGALAFHRSNWAPFAGGLAAFAGSRWLGPWSGLALPLAYAARNVDAGDLAERIAEMPGAGVVARAGSGALRRAGLDPEGVQALLGQGAGAVAHVGEHAVRAVLAAAEWLRSLTPAGLVDLFGAWDVVDAAGDWLDGEDFRYGSLLTTRPFTAVGGIFPVLDLPRISDVPARGSLHAGFEPTSETVRTVMEARARGVDTATLRQENERAELDRFWASLILADRRRLRALNKELSSSQEPLAQQKTDLLQAYEAITKVAFLGYPEYCKTVSDGFIMWDKRYKKAQKTRDFPNASVYWEQREGYRAQLNALEKFDRDEAKRLGTVLAVHKGLGEGKFWVARSRADLRKRTGQLTKTRDLLLHYQGMSGAEDCSPDLRALLERVRQELDICDAVVFLHKPGGIGSARQARISYQEAVDEGEETARSLRKELHLFRTFCLSHKAKECEETLREVERRLEADRKNLAGITRILECVDSPEFARHPLRSLVPSSALTAQ
ncbi:hypothetical protein ACFP1Z_11990 [Streptomyces gamaensis]|uniref:Uncharacterized protein n=1 Tax=Streptomyces gamaensis TaxID=1763542 RepID=A0ABW0YYN7_9ACTN